MPHEAELGLFARSFAIEPRLWIGSRGVGVVRALLAVKIRLPGPSVSVRGRFVRAILRHTPRLRSTCRRRRNGRYSEAASLADVQALRSTAWLRCRLPTGARGSWKKLSDPTPHRRRRCPRTSGTADRTPAAPSIAAPSELNRRLAGASLATASPVRSTAARSAHKAPRTPAPARLAPRSQVL